MKKRLLICAAIMSLSIVACQQDQSGASTESISSDQQYDVHKHQYKYNGKYIHMFALLKEPNLDAECWYLALTNIPSSSQVNFFINGDKNKPQFYSLKEGYLPSATVNALVDELQGFGGNENFGEMPQLTKLRQAIAYERIRANSDAFAMNQIGYTIEPNLLKLFDQKIQKSLAATSGKCPSASSEQLAKIWQGKSGK